MGDENGSLPLGLPRYRSVIPGGGLTKQKNVRGFALFY